MKLWQRIGMAVVLVWLSSLGSSLVLAQDIPSSTARIAAWNLAGIPPISDARLDEKVQALHGGGNIKSCVEFRGNATTN